MVRWPVKTLFRSTSERKKNKSGLQPRAVSPPGLRAVANEH
nr:MAG TPA: hypothetical protein [Caudoviricetes sp.]